LVELASARKRQGSPELLENERKAASDAKSGKYIPELRVFQAVLCIVYPAEGKMGVEKGRAYLDVNLCEPNGWQAAV